MPPTDRLRAPIALWAASVAAFAALYLGLGAANVTEWTRDRPADEDYNLLVRGFERGQLSLDKEVPAGLARLSDPYDPAANAVYRAVPYGLDDLSYFGGRLFLYFGATPALVLFWPWKALTGAFLSQRIATAVFCAIGFAASAGLLAAAARRYFPEARAGVVAALLLALGLLPSATVLLQKADVWETPIAAGYAFSMLALAAVWNALHSDRRRIAWTAAASAAIGLAIASRPALLPAAAVVLIPVLPPGGRPRGRSLAAALGPLACCAAAVLLYNVLRFGSPLDFGERYQLGLYRQDTARHFSLGYLAYNGWLYFFEPMTWTGRFPFVGPMGRLAAPPGHGMVEDPFGAVTGMPFLILALAAPLAWRGRNGEARATLRRLTLAVLLVFAGAALVLCLFYGNTSRYEVDFLPSLALLAALGTLAAERAIGGRRAARWFRAGWAAALAASLGFIALLSVQHYADQRYRLGNLRMQQGRTQEAIAQYRSAIAAEPAFADAQANLGVAYFRAGQIDAAIAADREALRLRPDAALTHYNLAGALFKAGRREEAEAEYAEAVRLRTGLRGP